MFLRNFNAFLRFSVISYDQKEKKNFKIDLLNRYCKGNTILT
jgi:hypothetical protein